MKKEVTQKVAEGDFARFMNAYPPRKGDRSWTPARKLFEKIVNSGVSAELLIDAAGRFAKSEAENINTKFVMQARRWLHNERWLDYSFRPSGEAKKISADPTSQVFVLEGTPQWTAWQKVKATPCVNFGWWFPSEWPPGVNP